MTNMLHLQFVEIFDEKKTATTVEEIYMWTQDRTLF